VGDVFLGKPYRKHTAAAAMDMKDKNKKKEVLEECLISIRALDAISSLEAAAGGETLESRSSGGKIKSTVPGDFQRSSYQMFCTLL
jgi:hypothetical protein